MLLGVAGAAFAVALPLASRWYPPEHQGTALGIAGAGNSGTVFAALFAPALAIAFGWQSVLGLCLIPLGVALVGLPDLRQGRAERAAAEVAGRIPAGAEGQGRLVVHVLLQRDLRRLRRAWLRR